jgi:curved DNA-binding protein CbpA
MAKTLYDILGVAESATDMQLKRAYEMAERALAHAPDAESLNALKAAREAYAILSDPARRGVYDRKLALGRMARESGEPVSGPAPNPPPKPVSTALLELGQKPAFLAFIAVMAGLFVYWNVESNRLRQVEAARVANEKELLLREQALKQAQQQLAEQQMELERQRLDMEQRMRERTLDSDQSLAIEKMQAEQERADRELRLKEAELELNRREQDIDLKHRDLLKSMEAAQKQEEARKLADERAYQERQRMREQFDRNIQSTRELGETRKQLQEIERMNGGE